MITKLRWMTMAVCMLPLTVACGSSSSDGGSGDADAKAVRTGSGLEGGRALSKLSDAERMKFCEAATATRYSASTPARECELTGVLNTYLLADPAALCKKLKDQCLESFVEIEVLRCVDLLTKSTGCKASVKDGEDCSFASASLRARLLPDLTCASNSKDAEAQIGDVLGANVLDATPECERYLTCQSGPPPPETQAGAGCDQLDECCAGLPGDMQGLCTTVADEARRTMGDRACASLKMSFGCT